MPPGVEMLPPALESGRHPFARRLFAPLSRPRDGTLRGWLSWQPLLLAAAVAMGVFSGVAITFYGELAAATLALAGLAAMAVAMAVVSEGRYRDWALLLILASLFLVPMLQKSLGFYLWGAWQGLLYVAATLLGLKGLLDYCGRSRGFAAALLLTALFLLFGLFSTAVGRSLPMAFAYQLMSDLKPLLTIALGFAVVWSLRTEALFWFAVRWLWLPSLLMVLFEWLFPSTYSVLFPHNPISRDHTGYFPSRAMGLFQHPSFLATTSALLALAAVARSQYERGHSLRYLTVAALYFLLIVVSVQRQEFIACLAAGLLAFLLLRPERIGLLLSLLATLVPALLGLFALLFWDNVVREAAAWGIGASAHVEHPRAQLLVASVAIAAQEFPLGSGLGTYGGAGAKLFDLSLYDELGFGRYWWFGDKNYLMDMYWPNPVAESGFIGALCLLLSYLALLIVGMRRALGSAGRERLYWAMFAAGLAYVLMLSLTSPAFQDPRLTLLALIWAGVAVRCGCQAREKDGKHPAGERVPILL